MKVAILLAEGFEEVETVTPIDFLRRADITVEVLGVTGRRVTGGHNITVECDAAVEDAGDYDAIICPGGMPGAENIAASTKALELIKKHYRKDKLIAAICAAPAVVLSPLGILDNRKATCFPGFEERFSDSVRFIEDRVVLDGTVLTSRGAGTAAEFACGIIEYLVDTSAADDIWTRTVQKGERDGLP